MPLYGESNFLVKGTSDVTLDFGFANGGEGDTATATIAATWVLNNSNIICQFSLCDTPDHGIQDSIIENITATATSIIPGVSFDVLAYAPDGTWGRYRLLAIGF